MNWIDFLDVIKLRVSEHILSSGKKSSAFPKKTRVNCFIPFYLFHQTEVRWFVSRIPWNHIHIKQAHIYWSPLTFSSFSSPGYELQNQANNKTYQCSYKNIPTIRIFYNRNQYVKFQGNWKTIFWKANYFLIVPIISWR